MSGAPAAHANTLLNQTCTGSVNIQFTPFLSTVYNGPYDRGYFFNCTDVILTSPTGVQLVPSAHSNRIFGFASGTCAAAVLSGSGDFQNGVGILIGGSVIVAASATPLSPNLAYAEVDVMNPNGVPCLSETAANDLLAANDTVF